MARTDRSPASGWVTPVTACRRLVRALARPVRDFSGRPCLIVRTAQSDQRDFVTPLPAERLPTALAIVQPPWRRVRPALGRSACRRRTTEAAAGTLSRAPHRLRAVRT